MILRRAAYLTIGTVIRVAGISGEPLRVTQVNHPPSHEPSVRLTLTPVNASEPFLLSLLHDDLVEVLP